MKIEKRLYYDGTFDYYYVDSKTGIIDHGLYNDLSWWGVGYSYHDQQKGFYLRNKNWL